MFGISASTCANSGGFGGLLVPFADKIDQCVVDVFRVRCAEEVLSAVHDDQVG